MASPFHRARIRWMREGEPGPSEDYEVRTISERAMFVKASAPPPAGSRGEVTLLDDTGRPMLCAIVRVVFRKPGSGVGVEVLETKDLTEPGEERESSRPPPRFDANGVEQRPPARRRSTRPRSRKPTAIGVGVTPPPETTSSASAPPKRSRRPRSQKPTAIGIPSAAPKPRRRTRSGRTLVGIPTAPPEAATDPAPPPDTSRDTQDAPRLDLDADSVQLRPDTGFAPVSLAPDALAAGPTDPAPPDALAAGPTDPAPPDALAAGPTDPAPPPQAAVLDAAESERALSSLDELPDALDLELPDEAVPASDSSPPTSEPAEAHDALPTLDEDPKEVAPGATEAEEDILAAPPELDLPESEPEPASSSDASLGTKTSTEETRPEDERSRDEGPSEMRADDTASVVVDSSLLAEARSAPPPKPREARVATRIRGKGKAVGVAIGIDLGTSNTCASAVIGDRPQVIPTRWGTNTIPSILAFIDGKPMVGHAAAKRLIMNPEQTIYGSKRLIGRTYTAQLHDEYQPYFAYPLAATDDQQFGAALPERVVSFEEVGQRLLAEVREVAEQHMGQTIGSAVVTVPAYFGETQREAVRRAARAAGLVVGRIVNEPTAAAVAYGYNRRDDATLVVFDLGGGTFDVSVLQVKEQRFEVLATGGDAFLGGIDIDDVLANYLLEEFLRVERIDLDPNPQQLARLREAAEECKRGLSMQHRFGVYLPHFATVDGKPRHLQVPVEQSTLTELTKEICDRLIDITGDVLADIGLTPRDVDDVLLVGGATRLPQVQDRVEDFFGRRPSKRINPDEAVALGAALLADKGGLVELIDVLPISIGYPGSGRRFIRLIARNTTVPTTRVFVVPTTEDDQLELTMPLFQGERADVAENEYLGTVRVTNIPPGPKGSDIELTLALDAQCMLAIRALHADTGIPLDVLIDREQSSDELIASLGPYEGPQQAPERKRPESALGRFFKKVRGLFRR